MNYYKEAQLIEKYGHPLRYKVKFLGNEDFTIFSNLKECRKRISEIRKQSGFQKVFLDCQTEVCFVYPDGREQRIGELNGNGHVILDEDVAAKKVIQKEKWDSEEAKARREKENIEKFLDSQDYYGHQNNGRGRRYTGRRLGHGSYEDRDEFERMDEE